MKHPVQKRLTRKIVDMVATDMLPLSFPKGRGFRDFMAEVDPQFRHISRRTLTRRVKQYVEDDALPSLKEEIANIPDGCIHSSSDLWEARKYKNILGVRLHYITDDWELKNPMIGLDTFRGRHTGANVIDAFEDVIM